MISEFKENGALVLTAETQAEADAMYFWFRQFESGDEDCAAEIMIEPEFVTAEMLGGEEYH